MRPNIIAFNILLLAILTLFTACNRDEIHHSIKIDINQNWEFSELGSDLWYPATVPGTVHSDLMDNGIITDPHYRFNEDSVQWIETKDWVYKTNLRINDELLLFNVVELQFDGLDTYASVYLNDRLLHKSENMFVGYKLDVKEHLQAGDNELKIIFHSAVNEGMKKHQKLDYILPAANEQAPYDERTNIFTRKAPFHYGWDWGPRLVTSGIWRPVFLLAHEYALIEDVYVETLKANKNIAELKGNAEIKVFEAGKYNFSLLINGRTQKIDMALELDSGLHVVDFNFMIDKPRLWWSNGLGDPYLYDFSFELSRRRKIISREELSFGVRTLRLVQEPDDDGRSFYFELNGMPVFMKGANVIPSETLTPLVSESTYRRLVENAVDANMNMLRVWGGAIYEEDVFYELCDLNGILVWQDFMFACALQPGENEHLENIKAEAVYNIRRLRNYASIALWCGNNENLHGWHHWGWNEMFEPADRDFIWKTYERIFYEILPNAVEENAPNVAYWASSPSAYGNELADRKSGDEHDWTIWFGQRPFSDYEVNVPRFVSEWGMQAFPNMHTIASFSEENDWDIDSPLMRHRQRSNMGWLEPGFDGNDMIKWYMKQYYNVPDEFREFVYVSQLLQAKAYKTAIEAHRRNMPHCMGSLYWQLNDSWPTISWATVDYYGRWKASHYAVREANKPLMISPVIEDDRLVVYAVNDELRKIDAKLELLISDFYGNPGYVYLSEVEINPNNSTVILDLALDSVFQSGEIIKNMLASVVLKYNSETLAKNLLYFDEPKNLELPEAEISVSSRKTDQGYELSISSGTLVKNLFLDTPFDDVFFTDNFVDILPGETKIINVVSKRDIDTANDLMFIMLNNI